MAVSNEKREEGCRGLSIPVLSLVCKWGCIVSRSPASGAQSVISDCEIAVERLL